MNDINARENVRLLRMLTMTAGHYHQSTRTFTLVTVNLASMCYLDEDTVIAYYKGEVIVGKDGICSDSDEWVTFITNNRNEIINRYLAKEIASER